MYQSSIHKESLLQVIYHISSDKCQNIYILILIHYFIQNHSEHNGQYLKITFISRGFVSPAE